MDVVVNLCYVFPVICKYCKLNLTTPILLLARLFKHILKYILIYIYERTVMGNVNIY